MKKSGGALSLETRFRLAKKVFKLTSHYDKAITGYLEKSLNGCLIAKVCNWGNI